METKTELYTYIILRKKIQSKCLKTYLKHNKEEFKIVNEKKIVIFLSSSVPN